MDKTSLTYSIKEELLLRINYELKARKLHKRKDIAELLDLEDLNLVTSLTKYKVNKFSIDRLQYILLQLGVITDFTLTFKRKPR